MAKKDDILPAVAVVGAVGVVGAVVAYKQGWFGKGGIVDVVTVEDPAGKPIPEAVVKLGGLQGVTGDTGQAKFTNLQPGTYTLSATAAGYKANSKQITIQAAAGADFITLTPSSAGTGLSMTLTPTSISPPASVDYVLQGGTPTGSWVIDAIKSDGTRLQLASGVFDASGQASGRLQFVNTQGGYGGSISATPPGAWTLFMTDKASGSSSAPATLTVKVSTSGGILSLSATPLTGNFPDAVAFKISGGTPDGRFTGDLTNPSGKTLPSWLSDAFDVSGNYAMSFLVGSQEGGPGVYTLVVHDPTTNASANVSFKLSAVSFPFTILSAQVGSVSGVPVLKVFILTLSAVPQSIVVIADFGGGRATNGNLATPATVNATLEVDLPLAAIPNGTYTATLTVFSVSGTALSTSLVVPNVVVGPSGLPLSVTISQPGGVPTWRIVGLTPNGQFNVLESIIGPCTPAGCVSNDSFVEYADANGASTLAFATPGAYVGTRIWLLVTDYTTGATAEAGPYTLQ